MKKSTKRILTLSLLLQSFCGYRCPVCGRWIKASRIPKIKKITVKAAPRAAPYEELSN
jgi:hypothetical protein